MSGEESKGKERGEISFGKRGGDRGESAEQDERKHKSKKGREGTEISRGDSRTVGKSRDRDFSRNSDTDVI